MSTVEDIVKVEREAAAQLSAARKKAETIKRDGQAEAQQIVTAARAKRSQEAESILAETEKRLAEADACAAKRLQSHLSARKDRFARQAPHVIDWIINQILSCGD